MDRICDYDEGYDRIDAYEIGWCNKCKCNPKCPYKKKAENDMRNLRGGTREHHKVFKPDTKAQFDKTTHEWFQQHIGAQTTVTCCEKCGLFYKPSLGHKCKKGE